jgi:hypothetical protein
MKPLKPPSGRARTSPPTAPESPHFPVRNRRQDRHRKARLIRPGSRRGSVAPHPRNRERIGCRFHPQIANDWKFFDYRDRKRRDKEPSAYDLGNFDRKRRSAYRGDHRPRHPDPAQVKIRTAEGSAAKERTRSCPDPHLLPDRSSWPSRNVENSYSARRSGSRAYGFALLDATTGICRCKLPSFGFTVSLVPECSSPLYCCSNSFNAVTWRCVSLARSRSASIG